MSAQEVPQLENAVEVKEGKLNLSAAAKKAFEEQAIFVDDCLARMDQLIRDNTAKIDLIATWGEDKLTSAGAQTVRERVAKELSALLADLPGNLALHNDERDRELRESLKDRARFSRIDDMKTEVEDQLDKIIQKAIAPGGGGDTTTEAMLAALQGRSNF